MRYEEGDFVKVYFTDNPDDFRIAQIVAYDKETDTYTINDLYSSIDTTLAGTLDTPLNQTKTKRIERITPEQVSAELL